MKYEILNKLFFAGFAFSLMISALLFNIDQPIYAMAAFFIVLICIVGLAKTKKAK